MVNKDDGRSSTVFLNVRMSVLRLVFTALHWMQGGLVTRKVCVRLSVCQMRGLWQNGRKICSDF